MITSLPTPTRSIFQREQCVLNHITCVTDLSSVSLPLKHLQWFNYTHKQCLKMPYLWLQVSCLVRSGSAESRRRRKTRRRRRPPTKRRLCVSRHPLWRHRPGRLHGRPQTRLSVVRPPSPAKGADPDDDDDNGKDSWPNLRRVGSRTAALHRVSVVHRPPGQQPLLEVHRAEGQERGLDEDVQGNDRLKRERLRQNFRQIFQPAKNVVAKKTWRQFFLSPSKNCAKNCDRVEGF